MLHVSRFDTADVVIGRFGRESVTHIYIPVVLVEQMCHHDIGRFRISLQYKFAHWDNFEHCLLQADRDLCMRLLLKVKGVVSVTFDAGRKRCLLRTRPDVKPEVSVSKTCVACGFDESSRIAWKTIHYYYFLHFMSYVCMIIWGPQFWFLQHCFQKNH